MQNITFKKITIDLAVVLGLLLHGCKENPITTTKDSRINVEKNDNEETKKLIFEKIVNLVESFQKKDPNEVSQKPLKRNTVVLKPNLDEYQNLSKNRSREVEEYGNKYANLVDLEKIIFKEKIKHNDYTIKVPMFFGIRDRKMKKFIEDKLNIKVNDEWNNIKAESKNDFLKKAKELEDKLRKAFEENENIFSEEDLKMLIDENQWKILSQKKDSLFMVRSTGREDSNDFSNAGGNESVAGVKCNHKDIFNAIKTVICSYFSEKSLSQRIDAKDLKSISSEESFMPILIQEMIYEKSENQESITSSGVLFTKDSSVPYIENQDKIFIQSTFGHGEGVVNSAQGIAVDTYYVNDNEIYAKINKKNFRLIINSDTSLHKVANKDTKNNSSLNHQQLFLLNEFVTKIYDPCKKNHQDVEFICQGKDIYIVQKRPLVQQKSILPKYILKKDLKNTIKLDTILSSKETLVRLDNKNEVIYAENLYDALEQEKNNKNAKLVVVAQSCSATSHEAIILASKNIAIIADTKGSFKKYLENANITITQKNPFYLSIQNSVAGFANNQGQNTTEIKEGMINYPVQEGLEFWYSKKSSEYTRKSINDSGEVDLSTHNINISFLEERKNDESYVDFFKRKLEELQENSDFEQKRITILDIVNIIRDFANKNSTSINKHFLVAKNFSSVYLILLYEVNHLLKKISTTDKNETQKMFVLALVTKKLHQYFDEIEIAQNLMNKLEIGDIAKDNINLWKIGLEAANQEVIDLWIIFVNTVKKNNAVSEANNFIEKLGDFAPVWMNSVFYNTYSKDKENLGKLFEFMTEERETTMTLYNRFIDTMNGLFAKENINSGAYEEEWRKIADDLFEKFIEPQFKINIKKMSDDNFFERYITVQLFQKFIDCWDLSIKKIQIKGATDQFIKAKRYIEVMREMILKMQRKSSNDWNILEDKKTEEGTIKNTLDVISSLKDIAANRDQWDISVDAADYVRTASVFTYKDGFTVGDIFTMSHQLAMRIMGLFSTKDVMLIQKSQEVEALRNLILNNLDIINPQHGENSVYSKFLSTSFRYSNGKYTETFNLTMNNHAFISILNIENDKNFEIISIIPPEGVGISRRVFQMVEFIKIMKCLQNVVTVELTYDTKSQNNYGNDKELVNFTGFTMRGDLHIKNNINKEALKIVNTMLSGAASALNRVAYNVEETNGIMTLFPFYLLDENSALNIIKNWEPMQILRNYEKMGKENKTHGLDYNYYIWENNIFKYGNPLGKKGPLDIVKKLSILQNLFRASFLKKEYDFYVKPNYKNGTFLLPDYIFFNKHILEALEKLIPWGYFTSIVVHIYDANKKITLLEKNKSLLDNIKVYYDNITNPKYDFLELNKYLENNEKKDNKYEIEIEKICQEWYNATLLLSFPKKIKEKIIDNRCSLLLRSIVIYLNLNFGNIVNLEWDFDHTNILLLSDNENIKCDLHNDFKVRNQIVDGILVELLEFYEKYDEVQKLSSVQTVKLQQPLLHIDFQNEITIINTNWMKDYVNYKNILQENYKTIPEYFLFNAFICNRLGNFDIKKNKMAISFKNLQDCMYYNTITEELLEMIDFDKFSGKNNKSTSFTELDKIDGFIKQEDGALLYGEKYVNNKKIIQDYFNLKKWTIQKNNEEICEIKKQG